MHEEFDQMIEYVRKRRDGLNDGSVVPISLKELAGQSFPMKLEYSPHQPGTLSMVPYHSDYYEEHMRKVNARLIENYETCREGV